MTDGWFKPQDTKVRKLHYFKNGRSLCKGLSEDVDFKGEAQGEKDMSDSMKEFLGGTCKVFEEELLKLRKKEARDKHRCSHIEVMSGMAVRCGEEVYENGLCRKHWLTTSQGFYGGSEMTGAEKENFDESE